MASYEDALAGSALPPRRAVVALLPDRDAAERAIRALRGAGFGRDRIGVMFRDGGSPRPGEGVSEGAAVGAVGGGVLGGLVGLLVGVGVLVIPGVGPVLAGGALATAFGVAAGTAAAGAVIGAAAGGVLGALVGLGATEEEARHFDAGFRAGGALVTVDAGERAHEAREVLAQQGADLGPTLAGSGAGGTGLGGGGVAAQPGSEGRERRRAGRGRRRTDHEGPFA